jgi:murein DD-endopeptidase MepM/ murein hydrolase activator NlpD
MTPSHRHRPTPRRDPALKTIRTNEVRYPGATLPPLPDDLQERYRAATTAESGGRLTAGVRDTGLAVEGRMARQQRAKRRAQRRTLTLTAVLVVGLALVVLGWRSASDKRATTAPLGGGASAAVAATQAAGGLGALFAAGHSAPPVVASSGSVPTSGPTPVFASYKKVKLHLPVRVKSLTEVGFHQASYSYALPMKTTLPDAKLSQASNHRGTGRTVAAQPTGPDAVLVGKVLRMWRPRPGRPDTAADVGAKPGSAVFAPVTGTVVKVKKYLLYGKWDDYELHVQPDGHPELDVVMIHVTDVSTKPGDRVQAGETRIAAVRKVSDKFYVQLSSYTKGGGNHVHLQVNDATDPKYKGLEGAIDPATEPTATHDASATPRPGAQ